MWWRGDVRAVIGRNIMRRWRGGRQAESERFGEEDRRNLTQRIHVHTQPTPPPTVLSATITTIDSSTSPWRPSQQSITIISTAATSHHAPSCIIFVIIFITVHLHRQFHQQKAYTHADLPAAPLLLLPQYNQQ